MPGILSSFLNEPNVHDAMMKQFENQLYLKPHGAEALGHVLLTNDDPHIPETAALDITPLGASAIRAVASIRNSADEMALANQQAQAIARNTKVASIRAYEALRSYQHILQTEEAAPDDEEVVYLRPYLTEAFQSLRQVSLDAVVQANAIGKKYHEVQNASRAFAEALNLPGLPVPPTIPPVMLQPPRRPRDLAPFWLDVPYAVSPGGDPYAVHDGGQRPSMAARKKGIPGFNPFEGTVPFGEAGFKPFYGKVGRRGKTQVAGLKAGLDVEVGKFPKLDMPEAKGFFSKAAKIA